MSEKIRAAATVLAISSAALIQAEFNRYASGSQNSGRQGSEASNLCPVFSADGQAIGTLRKVAAAKGRAGRIVVRTAAATESRFPYEIELPATASLDRHGRMVLPITAADLSEVASGDAA